MSFGVDRAALHQAAGNLRNGTQGAADDTMAIPDAGESTALITEVMAEMGMVAANTNEMAMRAAGDMDQCANDYQLNEQRITAAFTNLNGSL